MISLVNVPARERGRNIIPAVAVRAYRIVFISRLLDRVVMTDIAVYGSGSCCIAVRACSCHSRLSCTNRSCEDIVIMYSYHMCSMGRGAGRRVSMALGTWVASHFSKRTAPGRCARRGDACCRAVAMTVYSGADFSRGIKRGVCCVLRPQRFRCPS